MTSDNAEREILGSDGRRRRRIALDFDGVLHMYSKGWQNGKIYDDPVPGAVAMVNELVKEFDLVIFTCRTPISDVGRWFREKFGFNVIVTNEKPHADLYIDDRGFTFRGNWDDVRDEIDYLKENNWKTWTRQDGDGGYTEWLQQQSGV